MPTEKQEELSYEDDLAADAMAAFKEVSAKTVEVEPAKAAEPAAEKPVDAPAKRDDGRDDQGRFKAKDEKPTDPKAAEKDAQPAGPASDKNAVQGDASPPVGGLPKEQVTAAAPVAGPPSSWSIKAKAAWDQLPEGVRAEIAKRESEVSQGFGALKDYKDLKPWAERAQREGTTIAKALEHYTGFENVLRQDLGRGLATIAQNYGLNQAQAGELFAKLAQQYGGTTKSTQSPSNGAAPANGADDPLRSVLRPMFDPIMSEVQELRNEFKSRLEADRNAHAQTQAQAVEKAVEAFRSKPEHRYYAEVEQDIAFLIESGRVKRTGDYIADLGTAYNLAVRMHPEIQEALIEQRLAGAEAAKRQKEQEAVEKAKAASRSLTGNRLPGTTVREAPAPNGHDDVEADVRAAMQSLRSA